MECGSFFEVPEYFAEKHGLENPPYETWLGCPDCGGAYEEAKLCDCCGNYMGNTRYEVANGYTYCEECVSVIEN